MQHKYDPDCMQVVGKELTVRPKGPKLFTGDEVTQVPKHGSMKVTRVIERHPTKGSSYKLCRGA